MSITPGTERAIQQMPAAIRELTRAIQSETREKARQEAAEDLRETLGGILMDCENLEIGVPWPWIADMIMDGRDLEEEWDIYLTERDLAEHL